jgi:hypothetical protein
MLGLEGGVGVPLASPTHGAQAAAIYADASGSGGFMAWAVTGGELIYVVGDWTSEERERFTIAELELLASTMGLVSLAPHLPPRVVSFTDNVVAEAAMRAGAPRTPAMQQIVARRAAWLVANGIVEGVGRITSSNNLWADWGSRGRVGEVEAAARAAGLSVRRVCVPDEWRDTSALPSGVE